MDKPFAEIVDEHLAANRTELPVLDETAQNVLSMVESGDCDAAELERMISNEPVLTAAMLRIANSVFYGGLTQITSVRDAIMRIGFRKIPGIVIAVTQKEGYRLQCRQYEMLVTKLWSHSIVCALASQWLAERLKRSDLVDQSFTAGILHDLGKLFVLRVIDELQARDKSFDPPRPLVIEMLATMHCNRGADLMRAWNLPEIYVDTVARHHADDLAEGEALLSIVRVADLACRKVGVGIEVDATVSVENSLEAELLGIGDILAAELEIQVEEAAKLDGF